MKTLENTAVEAALLLRGASSGGSSSLPPDVVSPRLDNKTRKVADSLSRRFWRLLSSIPAISKLAAKTKMNQYSNLPMAAHVERGRKKMPELKVYSNGGRGMDYWSDDQVEGQIKTYRDDLEMLEQELSALAKKIQRRQDALTTCEDELKERYSRQEAERSNGT
jgi:hypothetical protein